VRPERVRLAHRLPQSAVDGRLEFPATVRLREDLGGEDIVYLSASGVPLTIVDRDQRRGDELDEVVTLAIMPRHLTLFSAVTGERIGQGAQAASGEAGIVSGARHV
jgi:hypothetical protein